MGQAGVPGRSADVGEQLGEVDDSRSGIDLRGDGVPRGRRGSTPASVLRLRELRERPGMSQGRYWGAKGAMRGRKGLGNPCLAMFAEMARRWGR